MTQPLIRYEISGTGSRRATVPLRPPRDSRPSARSPADVEESLSFTVDGEKRTLSPHVLGEFYVQGLEKIQYVHRSSGVLVMRAKVRGGDDAIRGRII